ncbi:hypothetical protein Tco_1359864 [Tanacetum coccineum]
MQKNLALLAKKPKRVKDYTYHNEKTMMMCKQVEQGVPLQAKQADWLEDTDEEIDEHELEAHYSFLARFRSITESINAAYVVEIFPSREETVTLEKEGVNHSTSVRRTPLIELFKFNSRNFQKVNAVVMNWKNAAVYSIHDALVSKILE